MRVLILGGYGNFGRLIAGSLAEAPGIAVIVAGRDGDQAARQARAIGAEGARVDANDPGLAARLADLGANLVISTAGPFQGQDYRVARAAIAAGAHYVDIADGRDFVCGIGALDGEARAAGVLAVSGASSVPALSAAVVDHYAAEFAQLGTIDAGICTSSRIPGDATVRAVLGYCGKPIPRWRDGASSTARGWLGLRRHRFSRGFSRWLGDCDVPDLALFPSRYPGVREVRFGAGLQPGILHLGLWMLAGAVRTGWIRGLQPATGFLARAGRGLEFLGSARSAMFVRLEGLGHDGSEHTRTWELVAEGHEGANIPCMAAVRLARKLARGEIAERGARPCIGLLTLGEYLEELRPFRVSWSAGGGPGLHA